MSSELSSSHTTAPGPESSAPPLAVVIGATGTGKSDFSLDLAEALASAGTPAEVINADAMQLYRGMSIGTAKLPEEERRGIPHHLFDALDVTEESTVADYQLRVRPLIQEIRARGHVPILVGGSGLYVHAALFDFRFPGADPVVRADLERRLEVDGLWSLVAELRRVDPAGAATLDLRNPRRVVRALEVLIVTGESIQSQLPETPVPLVPTHIWGLREERSVLIERLDSRVLGMWEAGLLAEVDELRRRGLEQGSTAPRAIGYAQALGQLRGELSEAEAIEETQLLTRRYARRQNSWFKRTPGAEWFPSTGGDRAGEIQLATAALLQGR